MARKVRIFVSYAHDDKGKSLDLFKSQLRGLELSADAEIIDDEELRGGDLWDEWLRDHLRQVDIVLALITQGFVGSKYIIKTELAIAKERHKDRSCVIIPVLLEDVYWDHLGIGEINLLPKDGSNNLTAISLWPEHQKASAIRQVIAHVAERIKLIVDAEAAPSDSAPTGIDLPRYRERAAKQWSAIDLGSLATPGAGDADVTIRLTDIFVPPNARRSRPRVSTPRDWLITQGLDPNQEEERAEALATEWERLSPEPSLDLLARPDQRLQVILGDPGAGKSSLTRFVLLRLLEPDLAAVSPLAPLRGHLPFLVELRDFVAWEKGRDHTAMLDYLDYRGTTDGFGFTTAAIKTRWGQEPSLLIIDGLDEIFDPARRKRMVDEVIGLTVSFPRLRILVTARIVGFDDHPFRSAGFTLATLTDLSPDQALGFARDWFPLVFPNDPAQAERKRQELERALERPQLRILAGNPLILTLMATIARHRPLARSRTALYEQALDLLCHTWDDYRGMRPPPDSPLGKLTPPDMPPMLRRIAWRMQEAPEGLRANAITQDDLRGVLAAFFRDVWHFPLQDARSTTEAMLERLQARNWILTLRGSALFGFVHRAFLEYLCALEIAERFKAQDIDAETLIRDYVIPHRDDETWHEVLRLLAGLLSLPTAERMILALVPKQFVREEVPTRLGLAWQLLAEVDSKSIPGLQHACGALTDALYAWCDAGAWDQRRQVEGAIVEAATTIGQTTWPVAHPPARQWPRLADRGMVFLGTCANGLTLASVLAKTVWCCPDTAFRYLHERAVINTVALVRIEAINALADHFRDHPNTLALIRDRALNDTDGGVRREAIEALGRHLRDHPNTLALIRDRALNDTNDAARVTAIGALGAEFHDHHGTLPLLRDRALNDTNGHARSVAIEALGAQFRDHPDTWSLLRDRVVNDVDRNARCAALLAWAGRSTVPHAATLCSEYFSGTYPGRDPRDTVTLGTVRGAAEKLRLPAATIRTLYEQLADEIALTLSWRDNLPTPP